MGIEPSTDLLAELPNYPQPAQKRAKRRNESFVRRLAPSLEVARDHPGMYVSVGKFRWGMGNWNRSLGSRDEAERHYEMYRRKVSIILHSEHPLEKWTLHRRTKVEKGNNRIELYIKYHSDDASEAERKANYLKTMERFKPRKKAPDGST